MAHRSEAGVSWEMPSATSPPGSAATSGYVEMLNHTRAETIAVLPARAASVGTNALFGLRFDSAEFDAWGG
jgi:uncharacterized protein YbjQ (UPF0145 family)